MDDSWGMSGCVMENWFSGEVMVLKQPLPRSLCALEQFQGACQSWLVVISVRSRRSSSLTSCQLFDHSAHFLLAWLQIPQGSVIFQAFLQHGPVGGYCQCGVQANRTRLVIWGAAWLTKIGSSWEAFLASCYWLLLSHRGRKSLKARPAERLYVFEKKKDRYAWCFDSELLVTMKRICNFEVMVNIGKFLYGAATPQRTHLKSVCGSKGIGNFLPRCQMTSTREAPRWIFWRTETVGKLVGISKKSHAAACLSICPSLLGTHLTNEQGRRAVSWQNILAFHTAVSMVCIAMTYYLNVTKSWWFIFWGVTLVSQAAPNLLGLLCFISIVIHSLYNNAVLVSIASWVENYRKQQRY